MEFNFNHILQSIHSKKSLEKGIHDFSWLEKSFQKPEDFKNEFFNWFSENSFIKLKSLIGQSYDFYHDLISRNLGQELNAFYDLKPGKNTSLTYDELSQKIQNRCCAFNKSGLTPGQSIALIMDFSEEFIVNLLSCLASGLVFCIIKPAGESLLKRQLEAAQVDFILIDPIYQNSLADFSDKTLKITHENFENNQIKSFNYEHGQVVGRVFAAVSPAEDMLFDLKAEDLFLKSLIDSVFGLYLKKADLFAAPAFDISQFQCGFLLSVLFSGSCYLNFSLEDLKKEPKLLEKTKVNIFGLCNESRDLFKELDYNPLKKSNYWFKNPSLVTDWILWTDFVKDLKLEKINCGNFLADLSLGGGFFHSFKRKGYISFNVFPAPAQNWFMQDLNLSGQISASSTGLFSINPEEENPIIKGNYLMGIQDKNYFYLGSLKPLREGNSFPEKSLLETVNQMENVRDSSMVWLSQGGKMGSYSFVLLIFLKANLALKEDEIKQKALGLIEFKIGEKYLPDKIEVYELYPKYFESEIDHFWCRSQYLSGSLYRRTKNPAFLKLSQLRDNLNLGGL